MSSTSIGILLILMGIIAFGVGLSIPPTETISSQSCYDDPFGYGQDCVEGEVTTPNPDRGWVMSIGFILVVGGIISFWMDRRDSREIGKYYHQEDEQRTVDCPECGAENPLSHSQCQNCHSERVSEVSLTQNNVENDEERGNQQRKNVSSEVYCTECGVKNPRGFSYCYNCGSEGIEEEISPTNKTDSNMTLAEWSQSEYQREWTQSEYSTPSYEEKGLTGWYQENERDLLMIGTGVLGLFLAGMTLSGSFSAIAVVISIVVGIWITVSQNTWGYFYEKRENGGNPTQGKKELSYKATSRVLGGVVSLYFAIGGAPTFLNALTLKEGVMSLVSDLLIITLIFMGLPFVVAMELLYDGGTMSLIQDLRQGFRSVRTEP